MATEPEDSPSSAAHRRRPWRVRRSASRHRVEGSTPGREKERRPTDPVRRAILLTPIVAIVCGLVVAIASQPDGEPVPSVNPSASWAGPAERVSSGYLVSVDELRRRGKLAAAGEEPYLSAAADLMERADEALLEVTHPTQPLVILGTDNPFVDDASRAYGLGLAYVISGDERYARASRRTIRDWMDVAVTTADTCPDGGGCHTSLIIGRAGPGFAFGADLIAGSPAWTETDRADLQAWMHNVLLPAVSHRPNNWGDAGTFLRVVAADYSGDQVEFDQAIEKWRSLIDLIEPDGRIPEEVRRGSEGISYTQEALQYKVGVARIAERRGINLWDHVGEQGGSLRKAIDRLADYWYRPDEWPDHPRPRLPAAGPMWEIAHAHWKEPLWADILLETRPYGDRGHSAIRWTTLTNGIPTDAPSESSGASGRDADVAVRLLPPRANPTRIVTLTSTLRTPQGS